MNEVRDKFDQVLQLGDEVVFPFAYVDRDTIYPSHDLVVGVVEDLSFTIGDTIKVRSTKPRPGLKTTRYDTCLIDAHNCVKISLVD